MGEQLDFTNTHIRLATNKVKLLQLRGKERVRTKTPLVGLEFVHFFFIFFFSEAADNIFILFGSRLASDFSATDFVLFVNN